VHFAFTSEQTAIRDAARALFRRECPPERVREAWSSPDGGVPGLAAKLVEMGAPGMLAPAEDGGLGLTEVELVLLLEEKGRCAAPGLLADTAAVAVPLLRDSGGAPRGRWLRALATGEAAAAVALADAPFVVGADAAEVLLLQRGDEIHAVDRTQVTLEARASIDGARRPFRVGWTASRETLVAHGASAERALGDAIDRGATAAAAELIGLARHMVESTVAYVKARHQFGKPIGSFQAVKHHLADAHIAVETSAPAVYRAAWSLATGAEGRSLHASTAKALASDAAALAARKALQCHGAIGYAFENDLHLWMKRAWALAASWGDAGWHRERAAGALLAAPPSSRRGAAKGFGSAGEAGR
jgi:alkylation response protein AidB-like acyl-CoA dehydrogenase